MGIVKLDRDGVTFALVLNALSTNTAADLLSAPSVLTLDNQEASIQAGQEVRSAPAPSAHWAKARPTPLPRSSESPSESPCG